MKGEFAHIRAALERARLITGWPETAIVDLCATSTIHDYADGDCVVAAGETSDALWVVAEGTFVLSRRWRNGRRFLYSYLRAGQSTGLTPVFDRQPSPYDILAREGGRLVAVSGETLRETVRLYPDIAAQVIGLMCRRAREDYETIELHAMNSVRCRIAKAVLSIAQGQAPTPGSEIVVDTRISQEDLADIVCAARQSVNRELRTLIKEGILKQRYRMLVILDRERLLRVAEEDKDISPVGRGRIETAPLHQAAD